MHAELSKLLTPAEATAIMDRLDTIRLPRKRGDETTFVAHGQTFRIKRLSADYALTCPLQSPRVRFGDRADILADVAKCLTSGVLPGQAGRP